MRVRMLTQTGSALFGPLSQGQELDVDPATGQHWVKQGLAVAVAPFPSGAPPSPPGFDSTRPPGRLPRRQLRQQRARELAALGLTSTAVARALRVSQSTAWRDIHHREE
jgi:hypothetical protein